MEIEAIRDLIRRSRWVYAKTYPKAPHEYTVFSWNPQDEAAYKEFATHIQEHGEHSFWYKYPRIYFHFEGYKYWIMSTPEECTLINRTFSEKGRYEKVLAITSDKAFEFRKGMTLAFIEKEYSQ